MSLATSSLGYIHVKNLKSDPRSRKGLSRHCKDREEERKRFTIALLVLDSTPIPLRRLFT
jgi:hypothetical protein